MVEQAASDYSSYFRKLDISKEINPLCTSIEEMLARLEEFESLLSTVKVDSNAIIQDNIPQILECQKEFNELCNRVDNLEKFLSLIKTNLDVMEETIDIAETELNITNYSSIKGLLKPFFNKTKNSTESLKTNLDENGEFKRPNIFKTSDYFDTKDENL